MQHSNKLFVAIEAGGTKFVAAIGNRSEIQSKASFPTQDPETTWREVIGFLDQAYIDNPFSAISLASFGPLELNPHSKRFGYLGKTPKTEWQGTDMLAPLKKFNLPVSLQTDVNAAALGEALLGAGRNSNGVAYVTVGTGIGAGIVMDGQIVGGQTHLEIGHIPVPHDRQEDPFQGICPYHKNCLEGLASGKAIHSRWGTNLNELANDHPAYNLQGRYLGYLCSTLILAYSPDQILLGGGVMQSEYLLDKTRKYCAKYLNGYPVAHNLEKTIRRPEHEGESALLGGFILASQPGIE